MPLGIRFHVLLVKECLCHFCPDWLEAVFFPWTSESLGVGGLESKMQSRVVLMALCIANGGACSRVACRVLFTFCLSRGCGYCVVEGPDHRCCLGSCLQLVPSAC